MIRSSEEPLARVTLREAEEEEMEGGESARHLREDMCALKRKVSLKVTFELGLEDVFCPRACSSCSREFFA